MYDEKVAELVAASKNLEENAGGASAEYGSRANARWDSAWDRFAQALASVEGAR